MPLSRRPCSTSTAVRTCPALMRTAAPDPIQTGRAQCASGWRYWEGYVLIGAETHRYHHAAEKSGNFGSVVPAWDILFRTFVYEPRRIPDRMGLIDPGSYPDPKRFHAALAWPFRRATA